MAVAAIGRIAASSLTLLAAGAEAGRLNKGLRMRSSRPLSACGVLGGPGAGEASNATSLLEGAGKEAAAETCAWRWQVALVSDADPEERPFCGGMLIHKEWVLTAENCARHANFSILAGDHNKKGAARQSRKAMSVFPHPQHSAKERLFDFALIRLTAPMEIGDCVGTVCLPTEGADIEPGTKCVVTGWGGLRQGGGQAAEAQALLQEAEVTTLSNEDCAEVGHATSIEDSMLCAQHSREAAAGDAGVDACQGDVGGPLVCEEGDRWIAFGAASWGHACGEQREDTRPGVWARIHEAVEWIDETLEINSR